MSGADDTLAAEQNGNGTRTTVDWPLLKRVPAVLAADGTIEHCRKLRQQAREELQQRFVENESVESLVRAGAAFLDALLVGLWRQRLTSALADRLCLVAVGGYGRGELHPWSDVDIMVLCPAALSDAEHAEISALITFLWDVGIEVGHSVRTVKECSEESARDVTVITTLIESRYLAGESELLREMRNALAPEHVWPVREFFEAKVREQLERHLKANDTGFNLEPNIKNGPGGLRDIQTIAWVAKPDTSALSHSTNW